MQIALLGPLEVAGAPVAGGRLRTLLARLALDAGRPVQVDALIDLLWGGGDQTGALQSLVSRLRRVLGDPALIAPTPAGYRLVVEAGNVDALRFAESVRLASSLGPADAASALRAALSLWRGAALLDVDGLAEDAERLELLRVAARADLVDAQLQLGEPGLVAALTQLAAERPLDERIARQLMTALGREGRTADALAFYGQVRARLADELGVDPSPELQEAHLAALRGDGPALRSRTNVRVALSSFVGRQAELARIANAVEGSRLVTLVGPGGAGKTRLANEAPLRAPDGVWVAELAPIVDAADVPATVLGALGLRESAIIDRTARLSPRDALTRLVESLADRQCVLILDNCEHVIDAAAHLTEHLLGECPGVRILTTSREPLGLFGENLVVVSPLGLPPPGCRITEVFDYPAVQLFADRASAVRPDFVVNAANVEMVVDIVRRLDGLPLAIELAAARLRALPLREVFERLTDRFRLLTGGSRTALPRHRTLRAVVEWSWDLLSDSERHLVERLAVFPASTTPQAAAAVCAQGDDVLDLLTSLADKSLLQEMPGTRFRMLETIREFGLERLAAQAELAAFQRAHAQFFGDLVREADPHLRTRAQLGWIARLDAERDNILGALRHLGDAGERQAALDLVNQLGWFWLMKGSHTEAAEWLRFALGIPGEADDDAVCVAEVMRVINSAASNEPHDVASYTEHLSQLARQLAGVDEQAHPMAPVLRTGLAMLIGDSQATADLVENAITSPDPWVAASIRVFRGDMAENDGQVAQMRVDAREALSEFEELGERWGLASALRTMAQVHIYDSDLDAAIQCYQRVLDLMAELGAREDEAFIRLRLADLLARTGDLPGARAQVALGAEAGDEPSSLFELMLHRVTEADLARRDGDLGRARRVVDLGLSRLERLPAVHPAQGHLGALMYVVATRVALDEGDLMVAARDVDRAYTFALGAKDMPILASVGLGTARFALELGDPVAAAEILGAADVVRGALDPTDPEMLGLLARLADHADAIERGRALPRAQALERLDPARLRASAVGAQGQRDEDHE